MGIENRTDSRIEVDMGQLRGVYEGRKKGPPLPGCEQPAVCSSSRLYLSLVSRKP
jgi:hypothetical protein